MVLNTLLGGSSSSSSTSTSSGGTNDNRNVYYECTGPDCASVRPASSTTAAPFSQNRNQLVTITTPSSTNPLQNITIPRGSNPNLNIPIGLEPPPDLQEALNLGGNVNLNCDFENGCPTLLPPRLRSSTTTSTTSPPPVFQISISPFLGGFNRRVPTEASLGTGTLSEESVGNNKTIIPVTAESNSSELPSAGIGEDFINEVYELDDNGRDKYVIVRQDEQVKKRKKEQAVGEMTAIREKEKNSIDNKQMESSEDIKEVLQALRGLLQILNTTNQGKLTSLGKQKFKPQGFTSAMEDSKIRDVVLPLDSFSRIQTVKLPGLEIPLQLRTKHVPPPHLHYSNVNFKGSHNSENHIQTKTTNSTTIPPHLIPLGPDAKPLLQPDGTLLAEPSDHLVGQQQQLSQRFPYLSSIYESSSSASPVLANSTVASDFHTHTEEKNTRTDNKSDDKDMITSMIDTVRDLPMDTKRHMLANMMFAVPMAAVTMAAAGVPHLAIAPLATLIPGFLFAAFTDTNPSPHGSHSRLGHGNGHDHGQNQMAENREGQDTVEQPPQQGLPALIAGLRQFYTHRRENQTLHISTGNMQGHQHHGK